MDGSLKNKKSSAKPVELSWVVGNDDKNSKTFINNQVHNASSTKDDGADMTLSSNYREDTRTEGKSQAMPAESGPCKQYRTLEADAALIMPTRDTNQEAYPSCKHALSSVA